MEFVSNLTKVDIISHGLWAGVAARAVSRKYKTKRPSDGRAAIRPWMTIFWGIFPDLLAFAPLFVWFFWGLAHGRLHFSDLPQRHIEDSRSTAVTEIFQLTYPFYLVGHSAVVFIVVLMAVWLVRRLWYLKVGQGKPNSAPLWEFSGWFLHILMDVPTHSYKFYPTPVLWPLSEWKFHGFSWATPWFLAGNYILLAIAFYFLRRQKKKKMENSLVLEPVEAGAPEVSPESVRVE